MRCSAALRSAVLNEVSHTNTTVVDGIVLVDDGVDSDDHEEGTCDARAHEPPLHHQVKSACAGIRVRQGPNPAGAPFMHA